MSSRSNAENLIRKWGKTIADNPALYSILLSYARKMSKTDQLALIAFAQQVSEKLANKLSNDLGLTTEDVSRRRKKAKENKIAVMLSAAAVGALPALVIGGIIYALRRKR